MLALILLAGEIFWAPMALAMMGGVIAATTSLPALYALVFRVPVPARRDGQYESKQEATTGRALPKAA